MPSRVENLKKELAERNGKRGRSPLEDWVLHYLIAGGVRVYDIRTEYQVDYYFIDFAFPEIMYALEVDGKTYHESEQQQKKDKKKDDYLKSKGWFVRRIPSSECWKPQKFGRYLKEIYSKLYPNRRFTYGLAELLGEVDEYYRSMEPVSYLNPCGRCRESHLSNEYCDFVED